MPNINALTKQKQIALFLAAFTVLCAAIAAGWYLSSANQRKAAQSAPKEPPPDMTGVVNNTFDDKVQLSAVTEFQVAAREIRDELASVRKELGILARERTDDQRRLTNLEADNKTLKEGRGNPLTINNTTGEPLPAPTPSPGTLIGNNNDIPPPSYFYPGMGIPPEASMTMQPVATLPDPNAIDASTFSYDDTQANNAPRYPYIPSGSFANAVIIEGADTNAAVTGQQNTVPMQLRLTGYVQMPNDHEYDLTGCFVSLEAWGDVSSERAITRTRRISCKKNDDVIDQTIAGHVSFRGKNGIKGEVIMRNGEILGWAWGAGFVDGIGQGIQQAGSPVVGVGGTAAMSGGDILQSGVGGGSSSAGKMLSEYYIKRAEQYHPIIPIGAGNEVTLVFQEGFQLETIDDVRRKKAARDTQPKPTPRDQLADPALTSSIKDLKVGDLVHLPTQLP